MADKWLEVPELTDEPEIEELDELLETDAATAAAATRTVPLADTMLLGTFGTEGEMTALVRRKGAVERVGVGDWLDGAQIVAVVPGMLRLLVGDSSQALEIPEGETSGA